MVSASWTRPPQTLLHPATPTIQIHINSSPQHTHTHAHTHTPAALRPPLPRQPNDSISNQLFNLYTHKHTCSTSTAPSPPRASWTPTSRPCPPTCKWPRSGRRRRSGAGRRRPPRDSLQQQRQQVAEKRRLPWAPRTPSPPSRPRSRPPRLRCRCRR